MASAILHSVIELFKSKTLGSASAQLGESESSVMRGFEASSAAIIGAIGNKATQTEFKQEIFDLVRSPENDTHDTRIVDSMAAFSGPAGNAPGEGIGDKLLSLVFRGHRSAVSEIIARSSGLRAGSASTLMSIAAPIILGMFGKRVREGGLDVSSFSSLLQREGAGILEKLPTGVGSLLGFSSPQPETFHPAHARPASYRWVTPLLVCLALLGGLVWLMNRNKPQTDQLADRAANVASETVGQVRSQADRLKNFLSRKLPNGIDLRIPSGGFEDRLVAFISDPARYVDPTEWFE